uniref:TGF-beta-activated kinase 1 and MAP3K7-binding protein 1 n=1 Tax=Strigamia maritima TaxID=126957 RepID=T1J677_STRMM
MPTREFPSKQGGIQHFPHELCRSWTDDLPVCRMSGVGLSTNQIYRVDGQRLEEHECEDRSFHFRLNEDTYFYGVFDGHEGQRAAHFAAQHMPAEVLLGQLAGPSTDQVVKNILHQAFDAVERGFFDSIGDLLAEKANLQMELPDGFSNYELYQKCPEIVDRLKEVNAEISGGTTAVVALIYNDRLYVANVGDSRALLCQNENGELRVIQLSVDHDLKNEDELLRLSLLGLNIDKIRSSSKLGNQLNTRCLGNYTIKSEYKDFGPLSGATTEPVIAEPEVHGGLPIAESFSFLLLMSDGLYKTLEEAVATEHANQDIAKMVAEQFCEQSTITGVAQAVVDKIVRLHHDRYMSDASDTCQKRGDMTLLVRQFNYSFQKAQHLSPTHVGGGVENTRYVIPANDPHFYGTNSSSPIQTPDLRPSTPAQTPSSQTTSTSDSLRTFPSRDSNKLQLDADGKIQPYVDFGDFYAAVKEAGNQTLLMGLNGNSK